MKLLFLFIATLFGQWALNNSLILAEDFSLEELARASEINPRDVTIDPDAQAFFGKGRNSLFSALLMKAPLKSEDYILPFGLSFVRNGEKSPQALLSAMSLLSEKPIKGSREELLESWIAESKSNEALRDLLLALKVTPREMKIESWPAAFREAVFVALVSKLHANLWVNRANLSLPQDIGLNLWGAMRLAKFDPQNGEMAAQESLLNYKAAVPKYKIGFITEGAHAILTGVEWAAQRLKGLEFTEEEVSDLVMRTSYGLIVIGSRKNNIHDYKTPVFLLVDVGGDDVYAQAGANEPRLQASSVSLDLSGSDRYEAKDINHPSFGAGVLGIGILWDEEGNDTYTASSQSEGYAHFGVGVVVDRNGDDAYSAISESQASAISGMALVLDNKGNDKYSSYCYSQGFSGVRGYSLLLDLDGEDTYEANDNDIIFPSHQDPKHNLSMSQGVSSGIRGDNTDTESLEGGVAFLVDRRGNDKYSGGVFSQGAGYWYGAGVLMDFSGNDNYKAHWYGEGASAHFASGFMFDGSGDDKYTLTRQMGLGAAHDMGTGIFVDSTGDDLYKGGKLSFGASNSVGVGVFLDRHGDDTYDVGSSQSLGWVAHESDDSIKRALTSYGLFFDIEGNDKLLNGEGILQGEGETLKGRRVVQRDEIKSNLP